MFKALQLIKNRFKYEIKSETCDSNTYYSENAEEEMPNVEFKQEFEENIENFLEQHLQTVENLDENVVQYLNYNMEWISNEIDRNKIGILEKIGNYYFDISNKRKLIYDYVIQIIDMRKFILKESFIEEIRNSQYLRIEVTECSDDYKIITAAQDLGKIRIHLISPCHIIYKFHNSLKQQVMSPLKDKVLRLFTH